MIEPYQYAVRHVRQLWELPTTNHNTTFRISRLRCTTRQRFSLQITTFTFLEPTYNPRSMFLVDN